jgi:5-deoxy-glucuronate isomerase
LEGYNVIHPAALPNALTADDLRVTADAGELAIDPDLAGWRYLSFRTVRVGPASALDLDERLEHAVVVIAGDDVRVDGGSATATVAGRPSPFDALPAAAYVPAGLGARLTGAGALVAVASAPVSGATPAASSLVTLGGSDIRVEIRGAGNATRQVNHIITPEFPADRLEVVEVLTPSGNWSSWPPHKHDVDDPPTEAVLEEVYFYQFRRPAAWGVQRLYRADRLRDCTWEVHTGEAVLVTDGYHPFVAAHGDDAYYLNALAGDRRTMACSYDPDWDWVRAEWPNQVADPRVPFLR